MRVSTLSKYFILCLVTSCFVQKGIGQLSGSNLMELQFGKLPDEERPMFSSIYNRVEANYRVNAFTAGLTLEQFTSQLDGSSYFDLSQLSLKYKKKKWTIKIGNLYETLGRGLLLRSFEIPGAILEDVGFRSRTYFHRDLLGASIKYKTKKVSFQALRADVLNNVLPPIFDRQNRRTDKIYAFTGSYKYYKKHKLGVVFLNRQQERRNDDKLISANLGGPVLKKINYYLEYAVNTSASRKHALYAGINGYQGRFGYSIEYKNYNDFIIGAGINEPPALIKQHTYRVLNRSTHVTNPLNEEGYQIDLFYTFKNGANLSFNHALASNKFGDNMDVFQEYFVEYAGSTDSKIEYKVFVDYSQDPFKNERNRLSAGINSDIPLSEHFHFIPEIELQKFDRADQEVYNYILSLGVNMKSKLFFSILAETTNDPFIIKENTASRLYLSSTVRYKPNNTNTIQVFVGTRRGGPLCSAGVCYEILDYKGVELRWTTRFKS